MEPTNLDQLVHSRDYPSERTRHDLIEYYIF